MESVPVDKVRRVVECILRAGEFDGRQGLLAQVPEITAVGGPVTMLELVVDRDKVLPITTAFREPVPVQGRVVADDGSDVGGLLVWVTDGYLSVLEHWWVTDDPPTMLPLLESLRFDRE